MQAVQDAFDSAVALSSHNTQADIQARAERYFFFAGDEPGMPAPGGMSVASPCIPAKTIWRCQVTPCVSVPVRSRLEEIPEGQMIHGSLDERTRKASYLLPAGPEADNLIHQYGSLTDHTRQWGLVELTALRGKSLDEVRSLRITHVFFPEWPNDVPDTNAGLIAHIIDVMKRLKTDASITPDIFKLYEKCAEEMISAARQAQQHQESIIGENNMRVTLPSTDANFKEKFDARDRLFAKRSGLALAVNAQRANQSDVLQQVVEGFKTQQQSAQVDPTAIAAIVAATMQAMQNQQPAPPQPPAAPEVKSQQPKKAA